jgi:hypothetical protein
VRNRHSVAGIFATREGDRAPPRKDMATDRIAEEVSRLVQDAAAAGRLLNVRREAVRLNLRYPDGPSVEKIVAMIVEASAGIAGMSIELGGPCDDDL